MRCRNRDIRAFSVLLGPLLLAGGASFAQTPGSPVPPLGPQRPLTFPNVSQNALPNGLRVFVVEDHRQPAISFRLITSAGYARDPAGKSGLAFVTADMLTQGTTTRSAATIAKKIDAAGAALEAAANAEFLGLSLIGVSSSSDDLCGLLADIAEHPSFQASSLFHYKENVAFEITAVLSDPTTLASAALDRVVYGNSPYGNLPYGSVAAIGGLTRDDIQAFYSSNVSPSTSVLFVVGDITAAAARDMALKWFGAWEAKPSPASVPPPPPVSLPANAPPSAATSTKPAIVVIDRPGAQQTEIRIGTKTSGYRNPQRVAGDVATAVLGQGQASSRLTLEIRNARGLTYNVASAFDRNRDIGEFAIKTYTKNASTGEVLRLVLDEARKIAATPPTAAELADHKTYLTGSFAISLASADGFMESLIEAVLDGDGLSDLTQYAEKVAAVTGQDVSDAIAGLHLESARIVLVGDVKSIESQVREIGPVTVIEPADLDLTSPSLLRPGVSAVTLPALPPPPDAPASGSGAPTAAAMNELLAPVIAAHGGDSFLALKTISADGSGELRPPGIGIRVTAKSAKIYTVYPDRAFMAMTTGFGKVTVGAPGGGKDIWYRFAEATHDLPGLQLTGDPTAVLRLAVQNHYKISAEPGIAGEKGEPALQGMQLVDGQGHATHAYFDPATHLLRRVDAQTEAGATRFDLSDYKKVDKGVLLPSRIVSSLNGQRVLTLDLSTFTLNQPVADSLFLRPAD